MSDWLYLTCKQLNERSLDSESEWDRLDDLLLEYPCESAGAFYGLCARFKGDGAFEIRAYSGQPTEGLVLTEPSEETLSNDGLYGLSEEVLHPIATALKNATGETAREEILDDAETKVTEWLDDNRDALLRDETAEQLIHPNVSSDSVLLNIPEDLTRESSEEEIREHFWKNPGDGDYIHRESVVNCAVTIWDELMEHREQEQARQEEERREREWQEEIRRQEEREQRYW